MSDAVFYLVSFQVFIKVYLNRQRLPNDVIQTELELPILANCKITRISIKLLKLKI